MPRNDSLTIEVAECYRDGITNGHVHVCIMKDMFHIHWACGVWDCDIMTLKGEAQWRSA